jgi:putative oxidoreductase
MLIKRSCPWISFHSLTRGAIVDSAAPIARDRLSVDVSLLVLRIIVGIIMAAHGAQKLFGWFDGHGMEGLVGFLGPVLAYAVAIGEFFGGVGLIVGFLTRFSAASLIVIMIGAIVKVHGPNGFFSGKGPESMMKYAGFEYNLALIGLLVPILLCGPGRISVGRFLPLPKSKQGDRPTLILE